MKPLVPQPLTQDAFAPFGTVIEASGSHELINQGTSQKFADLALVELDDGAQAALHLYKPQPVSLPCPLRLMERHPLASQAFIPLERQALLVVVGLPSCFSASSSDSNHELVDEGLCAFLSNGRQGIQFAAGVWHHPLLSLDPGEILIVDRHCSTEQEREANLELVDISDHSLEVRT